MCQDNLPIPLVYRTDVFAKEDSFAKNSVAIIMPQQSTDPAQNAIDELERAVHAIRGSSIETLKKSPNMIASARNAIEKLNRITCPHPAFAAGRCFRCDATYEEAGV